jgi:hypothetical protein
MLKGLVGVGCVRPYSRSHLYLFALYLFAPMYILGTGLGVVVALVRVWFLVFDNKDINCGDRWYGLGV